MNGAWSIARETKNEIIKREKTQIIKESWFSLFFSKDKAFPPKGGGNGQSASAESHDQ